MMMTVVEVKMTTTTRTFGDGEEVDLIDNDDIYIMMQFCLSRKIITSSWESPVTTQDGFSWF